MSNDTLEKFAETIQETCLIEDQQDQRDYSVLNLAGEAGEIVSKYAKAIRDNLDTETPEFKKEILKELGDVLWCAGLLATSLDSSLEEVMNLNIEKVQSRKARGVQQGNGDNR